MAVVKKKRRGIRTKPIVLKGKVIGRINGFPIRRIRAGDLQEAHYNPRKISEQAMAGLKASTDEFGMVEPIVWNKRFQRLVGGHQRLKTIDPEDETDVIEVDLDEEREKALNVALNNPHIAGEWTSELAGILASIEESMPQVATDLRFGDLAEDLENLSFLDEDGEGGGDTKIPEPEDPPEDPVSEEGKVYQLGPHRLMCGDSTNPKDVAKLMNGEKAKLLATDPPYLVGYSSKSKKPQHDGQKTWDQYKGDAEAIRFFHDWLFVALKHCDDRVPIYQWHADMRRTLIEAAWKELGLLCHQTVIWAKKSGTLGRSDLMWRHEPCLYGWPKGMRPPKGRRPPPNATTVWDDIANENTEGNHPTQKPVELFARVIRWHLRRGELCLESFAGSGSCLIAAAVEKRICYAMESEPAYVDVIRKRWGDFARANKIDPGSDAL